MFQVFVSAMHWIWEQVARETERHIQLPQASYN